MQTPPENLVPVKYFGLFTRFFYFPLWYITIKPPSGKYIKCFPTTLSKSKSMTQVKNCSHPVWQDSTAAQVGSDRNSTRRGGDRVAWAGSATFATPRCIEEVPWPGVYDMWEEVCLIGLNIIMRIYEIWKYTYTYAWWYILFYSLVVIHLQLETRGCMCADSDSSGGWQLQKYWPPQTERNAELGCAWWEQGPGV